MGCLARRTSRPSGRQPAGSTRSSGRSASSSPSREPTSSATAPPKEHRRLHRLQTRGHGAPRRTMSGSGGIVPTSGGEAKLRPPGGYPWEAQRSRVRATRSQQRPKGVDFVSPRCAALAAAPQDAPWVHQTHSSRRRRIRDQTGVRVFGGFSCLYCSYQLESCRSGKINTAPSSLSSEHL